MKVADDQPLHALYIPFLFRGHIHARLRAIDIGPDR